MEEVSIAWGTFETFAYRDSPPPRFEELDPALGANCGKATVADLTDLLWLYPEFV